jgi:RNA polymerase sigma-70 factor (ECF subfamily)
MIATTSYENAANNSNAVDWDRLGTGSIIERMADGSGTACGRFHSRYSTFLLALARRKLGDQAEAEDLVQDVLMQVWNQAERYRRDRGTVRAWVSTILSSRAIDRLRRRQRRARTLSMDVESGADPLEREATGGFGRLDASMVLEAALKDLPVEQRRALELSYLGGLSHSEVAESLESPLGTVKTRIRLGMKRLRQILAPTPFAVESN